jgi:hypothetical protein
MGGWLQKILASTGAEKKPGKLPASRAKTNQVPASRNKPLPKKTEDLPTATVIYGIGASLVFVDCFSLFLSGHWVLGILVFFIGGCLSGFALFHLKYRD